MLKYSNPTELQEFILKFSADNSCPLAVVVSDNCTETLETIKGFYHFIEAAGGLVKTPGGELLFIHRLGVWDLPKGKAEAGETPEQTALREVEEECGVQNLSLSCKITDTYHTYQMKGKWILKRTHWYAMSLPDKQMLTPQLEEDILAAEWIKPERLPEIMQNTYPSIVEVIKEGNYFL